MTHKIELMSNILAENLTTKINSKHKQTSKKAFTLLELLVVIAILGMLAAFVVPAVIGKKDEAQRDITCTQMAGVEDTLETFKMDNSVYPDTEEGLKALLSNPDEEKYPQYPHAPYYKELPKDSWGMPFVYIKTGDGFKLMSFASDRKEGGEDSAKDIIYPACKK